MRICCLHRLLHESGNILQLQAQQLLFQIILHPVAPKKSGSSTYLGDYSHTSAKVHRRVTVGRFEVEVVEALLEMMDGTTRGSGAWIRPYSDLLSLRTTTFLPFCCSSANIAGTLTNNVRFEHPHYLPSSHHGLFFPTPNKQQIGKGNR
jgi:hypothetical protein